MTRWRVASRPHHGLVGGGHCGALSNDPTLVEGIRERQQRLIARPSPWNRSGLRRREKGKRLANAKQGFSLHKHAAWEGGGKRNAGRAGATRPTNPQAVRIEIPECTLRIFTSQAEYS